MNGGRSCFIIWVAIAAGSGAVVEADLTWPPAGRSGRTRHGPRGGKAGGRGAWNVSCRGPSAIHGIPLVTLPRGCDSNRLGPQRMTHTGHTRKETGHHRPSQPVTGCITTKVQVRIPFWRIRAGQSIFAKVQHRDDEELNHWHKSAGQSGCPPGHDTHRTRNKNGVAKSSGCLPTTPRSIMARVRSSSSPKRCP